MVSMRARPSEAKTDFNGIRRKWTRPVRQSKKHDSHAPDKKTSDKYILYKIYISQSGK